MKQDKLIVSIYNDYYGAMLTSHQRQMIEKYYDDDMSLSEIGREFGISAQGVRDTLQRAESSLMNFEEKLGLVAKTERMKKLLLELSPLASQSQKKEIASVLTLLDE
ncbi:MAG: sigma factor-like helix-turn-helix DNA-binding protein [Clostridia bacterium]